MIIPTQEKPFAKKDLKKIISQQKNAWILVLLMLPLLSIFTLYLFSNYTIFKPTIYFTFFIVGQILYSIQALVFLVQNGIRVNKNVLNQKSNDDLIFFTQIVEKKDLGRIYIGLGLFFLLVLLVALSFVL